MCFTLTDEPTDFREPDELCTRGVNHARVSPLQSLRFAGENQLVTANILTALQPRGIVQIVHFPSGRSYFGFAAGFASGFGAGTPRGSSAGFT